jgi:DNA-directed RNA polymerase subunit M/transcription elongation factor TFIIS
MSIDRTVTDTEWRNRLRDDALLEIAASAERARLDALVAAHARGEVERQVSAVAAERARAIPLPSTPGERSLLERCRDCRDVLLSRYRASDYCTRCGSLRYGPAGAQARRERAQARQESQAKQHRVVLLYRQQQIEADPKRHTCPECGLRSYNLTDHLPDCITETMALLNDWPTWPPSPRHWTAAGPTPTSTGIAAGNRSLVANLSRHRPQDMSRADVFRDDRDE